MNLTNNKKYMVVLFHLMLACLYVNVSFTTFVLQWLTSSMSQLAPPVARHFQCIIFTANKIWWWWCARVTFPSLIACLYLFDSRDREWCLHHASRYNFCLLWPWPLTS